MEFWLGLNSLVLFLQKVKICLYGAIGHSKELVINVSQRCFHSLMTRNIKLFEQKRWLTGSNWFAESHQLFFCRALCHNKPSSKFVPDFPSLLVWVMKMNTLSAKAWSKVSRICPEQSTQCFCEITNWSIPVAKAGATQRLAPALDSMWRYQRVQLRSLSQGATSYSISVSHASCSCAHSLIGVD